MNDQCLDVLKPGHPSILENKTKAVGNDMSYDDEQQRSRVVINTPTSQREVVRTETTRVPVREGISTGAVAAIVVGAVALVTILFLFLMKNQQDTVNNNTPVTAAQPQQQPIIIQQPAPAAQQPIVVQQPGTTQPVIVQQPPAETTATLNGTDDASIQSNIDRKMSEDTTLASLGVSALVSDGRVTLTGTVGSEAMKSRVERVVNNVKGVRGVENQIVVMSPSR